jgi:hypothetical protein
MFPGRRYGLEVSDAPDSRTSKPLCDQIFKNSCQWSVFSDQFFRAGN